MNPAILLIICPLCILLGMLIVGLGNKSERCNCESEMLLRELRQNRESDLTPFSALD